MHRVRNRRGAATVRELWLARDAIAVERDVSPGRVLQDVALIDLAVRAPRTSADIVDGPGARSVRRYQRLWLAAVDRARQLPEAALPQMTLRSDGPPPARAWAEREPAKAARLAQTRAELAAVARERTIPVENLLSPDAVRRVLWSPPPEPTRGALAMALADLGVRPWQIEIAVPILAAAIDAHPEAAEPP